MNRHSRYFLDLVAFIIVFLSFFGGIILLLDFFGPKNSIRYIQSLMDNSKWGDDMARSRPNSDGDEGGGNTLPSLNKSEGGLSISSSCPASSVSIGNGYCQEIGCFNKVIQYNGRPSESGVFYYWDYHYTGYRDDPRLVKLGLKCNSGQAIMLGKNVFPERSFRDEIKNGYTSPSGEGSGSPY